jgi:hypothetical protein
MSEKGVCQFGVYMFSKCIVCGFVCVIHFDVQLFADRPFINYEKADEIMF